MADTRSREMTGWTGWVAFGSIMMIFSGVVQFVYGLAALSNQHWLVYTDKSAYIVNVSTWGWAMLLTGILMVISGWLLIRGNMFGRTVGVIVAILNILEDLALITAAPVWAILAIIVNALVVYAIWAHGRELQA